MEDNGYPQYCQDTSRLPEPPYRAAAPGSQGTAGQNASSPYSAAGAHNAPASAYEHQQTQRFQPAPATAPAATGTASKRKSGGGKSFLFGFLGALLACALSLGGYTAWLSSSRTSGGAGSSTLIGSTDPTVISAVDEGQSLSVAVAAKALPSVVAIYNYQEAGYYGYGHGSSQDDSGLTAAGMGSGVVISDDGYIMTNYHVVEGADKLTVNVDGKERDAEYVGGDSSSDIAVLKVDDTSGLVAADIGDSDSLVIGEWVMTIGAPLGLEQSVATGVVSATNRSTIMSDSQSDAYGFYYNSNPEYTYYPNMIQTDALINPGNSGGALVDADGKLIGINSMLSSYSGDYAGVGFAIPINYAIGIAQDIIDGKEPTHAALGVAISQVNAQIAKRYNLATSSGAYISEIYEGTGAAESDLEVGDIIVAIDGKEVDSTTSVTLDVREHKVGDAVVVTVNRDGVEYDIDVVLTSDESFGTHDDSQQQSPFGNGNGYDNGNGYNLDLDDIEDLEDLLRLFGM